MVPNVEQMAKNDENFIGTDLMRKLVFSIFSNPIQKFLEFIYHNKLHFLIKIVIS